MPWEYGAVTTPQFYGSDQYSYGNYTQTRVMVEPSGQTLAGTTNLYLVLANANEFSTYEMEYGPEEYGYGWDYEHLMAGMGTLPDYLGYGGDTPLPPEWLQIRGQTLLNSGITNGDGSVSGMTLVSAPAGVNWDVTPVATQVYQNQAYTFNVQAYNVSLQIIDANTGTNLTLQTNTVIVGQQMNWYCQLSVTNALLNNGELTNFQWTVPGYAISNYVVAADASSAMVVTNFPTINSNVVFYWVDGASYRVIQCSATVQGKLVTGQAVFNIYRPSVTFTDEPPSWATNDVIDGTLSLSLGGSGGDGSMSFRVDVSSTNSGKTDFTQLINRSAANGNTSDSTSGQYWMDNTRFYLSKSSDNAAFIVFTNHARTLFFNDGPNFALAHSVFNSNTSIVDQFKDYIMFRPKNGNVNNNIYVPLGKITWLWSASTTYSGGTWPPPTFSITRPSNPDGGLEFPQWPQTYHNN
jgi:hypothetical protein